MRQDVSKTQLRKQLRTRRRQLTVRQRQQASDDTLSVLRQQRLITAGRRVAVYWPFDGELDTTPIIIHAWSVRAQILLPVVSVLDKLRLGFAPLNPETDLKLDRYGIPTPQSSPGSVLTVQQIDLILLPLVAFDRHGSRLGMGAGHYDATVGYLRGRCCWRRPRLIGVGYSFQEVESVPLDAWDLVMHGVVTDKEFIEVKSRQ